MMMMMMMIVMGRFGYVGESVGPSQDLHPIRYVRVVQTHDVSEIPCVLIPCRVDRYIR